MTSSVSSTAALPPVTLVRWLSIQVTFWTGSSKRDGNRSGRSPAWRVRSAVRAAALADRTEAKVATASTRVPPAVASAEIVVQSAIRGRYAEIGRFDHFRMADDRPLRPYWVALVQDRKSTRLNSSHSSISYAVFCLK